MGDICRFEICHGMVSLQKLYSVTMSYFLKIKNYMSYISETMTAGTIMHRMTYIDLDICQLMIDTIAKITSNDIELLFQGKKC